MAWRIRRTWLSRFVTVLFWLLALLYLYPLLLIALSSVKSSYELASSPSAWPVNWIFDNYREAIIKSHYIRSLRNSFLLTGLNLFFLVLIGVMAAYALSRWQSKLANGLYFYFVCGMAAPLQLGVVPLYKIMRDFHLFGSIPGLALIYAVAALPFSIFLWTGFIRGLPIELEESAQIDGCSMLRLFWQIVFPLLKPVTATVLILNAIGSWNNFLYPLLFLPNPNLYPLPMAIFEFVGQYSSDWPGIFAVIAMIEAPVLLFYLMAQKHIIKGMTGGAVKG
ncbi:carbohydrate ABC transporter permease [Cohnella soli]|uniref:Carbohydrate ABC transporter permease n=1 Tax=Cohnella soli TaxID=425005 RepID=A0ABW0HWC5_9BACL